MRTLAAKRLLCLALALGSAPAFAGNLVVATASVPPCSTSVNRAWEQAAANQLGAAARDPEGEKISTPAVFEDDLWPNPDDEVYRPYSAVKRTFCGLLDRYGFYDATWSDEADWNLLLIPTPAFAPMLTQAISRGAEQIHDCGGGSDNCIEAEITPDEQLYTNPFFPSSGPSPMIGRTICAYGPWVADFGHGRRPEIHPSEALWWRSTEGAVDWTTFILVQDDSNRFDRPSRGEWYFRTTNAPPGWRPWSRAPRRLDVRFPFEAGPGLPVYQFDLHEMHTRFVTTSNPPDASADADDGKHHALEYNGKVVVAAQEIQVRDEDLGVTFSDLCRNGSVLRGFVQVAARIGEDDHGREGFLELRVGKREMQANPVLPEIPPRVLTDQLSTQAPEDGMVLTPGSRTGGPLADLPFQITAHEGTTTDDLTVVRAELIDASGLRSPVELQLTQKPVEGVPTVGVLRALPAIPAWTLELTAASGRVYRQENEGHTVLGRLEDQSAYAETAGFPLWETLVGAAGGRAGVVPGTVAFAAELRLLLDAGYVPLRGGESQPEEGSSASRALNLALGDQNPAKRTALFGTAQPLTVRWTVTATNLSLGTPVRVVETTNPAPGTLGYKVTTGNAPELDSVRVILPPASANELFEVRVTAVVRDPFGDSGQAAATLWSHALLPEGGVDALLVAAAEMRSLDALALLSASKLDLDATEISPELDAAREAARGVRLSAEAALADGNVTVAELAEILAALDLYAEQPRPAE